MNQQNTIDIEKPNIIYIMLDEWGFFEWSAMGHPILQTPNIDKMASEGIRFTQILAGVCAPTRCALMTGQHTGHTTIRANGGGLALREDDVTIAEMLKAEGYATGGFGKWGLGDTGTTVAPLILQTRAIRMAFLPPIWIPGRVNASAGARAISMKAGCGFPSLSGGRGGLSRVRFLIIWGTSQM